MHTQSINSLFVITGGPGSGKSTLIAALAARGISVMPEAGRAIIRDQAAIGGSALPWADRAAYAELMLSWELRSYREALEKPGPVNIIFHEWVAITRDLCRRDLSWKQKMNYVFGPPGWSHDGSRQTSAELRLKERQNS